MISKIAEAVFDNCCPGIRYTEEDKVFYEQMIKVVLKTMREPTEKMISEGAWVIPGGEIIGEVAAKLCYETMIDAALNE